MRIAVAIYTIVSLATLVALLQLPYGSPLIPIFRFWPATVIVWAGVGISSRFRTSFSRFGFIVCMLDFSIVMILMAQIAHRNSLYLVHSLWV